MSFLKIGIKFSSNYPSTNGLQISNYFFLYYNSTLRSVVAQKIMTRLNDARQCIVRLKLQYAATISRKIVLVDHFNIVPLSVCR